MHAERIGEITPHGGKDEVRKRRGRRAVTSTEGQKRELDVKNPLATKTVWQRRTSVPERWLPSVI